MALKSEVENLQHRLREHTDFLESIRNAPEDEVLSIVRQIRSAENASAVLSSYQGRVGGVNQFSERTSARAAIPSTESGVELELVMLHPTAYPVHPPPAPSSVASTSLTREPGLLHATTSSSSTSLPPGETYTYRNPRLEHLTVSYWTRIPIDDQLAAQAISHYLDVEHPVIGFFDAELFVRDLVEQRLNFCSSFLFSSVMSLACVRHLKSNSVNPIFNQCRTPSVRLTYGLHHSLQRSWRKP